MGRRTYCKVSYVLWYVGAPSYELRVYCEEKLRTAAFSASLVLQCKRWVGDSTHWGGYRLRSWEAAWPHCRPASSSTACVSSSCLVPERRNPIRCCLTASAAVALLWTPWVPRSVPRQLLSLPCASVQKRGLTPCHQVIFFRVTLDW